MIDFHAIKQLLNIVEQYGSMDYVKVNSVSCSESAGWNCEPVLNTDKGIFLFLIMRSFLPKLTVYVCNSGLIYIFSMLVYSSVIVSLLLNVPCVK